MAIVYNNKQIQHAYYGDTPIHQIYLGDQLKWADAGELYAFGRNDYGQLGVGDTTPRDTPVKVGEAADWVQVAGAGYHSLAINSSGQLYAWGRNANGQLGVGDTTNRNTPTRVGLASDWVYVACGGYQDYGHSLAINSSGELYAWGYNSSGQLGLGDTAYRLTPTRVGVASDWVSVSGGGCVIGGEPYFGYSLALNSSGELYTWGYNNRGQLGLGDTTGRDTPAKVGSATDWIYAVCGSEHSMASNSSGRLYTWGRNANGQLGLDDTTNRDVPTLVAQYQMLLGLSAGYAHSLLIKL